MHIGAAEVARRRATEGTDDADPDVLLADHKSRRMRVEDLAVVALGPGLPVRGCLHVQAHIRKLGREGDRHEKCVLLGAGEDLLAKSLFGMGGVDREAGNATHHEYPLTKEISPAPSTNPLLLP